MLKPELLILAKAHQGKKSFVVDELAKAHGCEVIRLPPYHCHFNPIEMAWGFMKEWVAKRNRDGRLESVKRLFDEAKQEAVNRRLWEGWCRHVKDLEDKQWEKDRRIDEVEPFFIFVGEDDEEGDEDDLEEVEEERHADEIEDGLDVSFDVGLDDSGLDSSGLGVSLLGDDSVLETSVSIEDPGEGTSADGGRLIVTDNIGVSSGEKKRCGEKKTIEW